MARALVALVALGGVLLAGCTSEPEETPEDAGRPVEQVPVEVDVEEPTADPVTIGVVATLSVLPGQGADALPGAEGAQVAAFRLDLGGQPVELEIVDDGGTEDGARAAVEQLVNARVAGIVAATTGDHVLPALEDAAAAETAVLLPYLRTDATLPDGAYSTGGTQQAVGAALAGVLKSHDLQQPFVVNADGVTAPGVEGAQQATFTGRNSDAITAQVRRAQRSGAIDSAVIAGSAASQAQVASRLQGAATELPLVLTPEALSPLFAEQLQEFDGTTSAQFLTVGVDASDATTLTAGARAESMASYFAGLRLLSQRSDAQDLFNSLAFSQVAGGADTPSHDAVIALATAAVKAGSVAPADVREALAGLKVDFGDGLAGPNLDFADSSALPDNEVVELNATSQDPGVRPELNPAGLFWFAVPASAG